MCSSLKKFLALSTMVFALVAFGSSSSFAAPVSDGDELLNDNVVISNAQEILTTNEMVENRGAAGSVENTITSAQTLAASTSGNSLNVGGDMTNGDINIGNNLGGFGSYVMNTGNNSTINSAVSFNVQIMSSPAP